MADTFWANIEGRASVLIEESGGEDLREAVVELAHLVRRIALHEQTEAGEFKVEGGA